MTDPERAGAEDPAVRLSDLWREGQRPDVREFLREAGDLTVAQIVAILSVDQWQRWQAGERVLAETHLAMHPALAGGAEEGFDLVYGEFLLREELEEAPAAAEYLTRFPQFTGAIQRQFDLHRALETGLESVEARHATASESSGSMVTPPGPGRPAPVPELQVPTIPGYEILGQIGRGGMGVVYKARHERLKRIVALKVIHKDRLSQNPEAVRRFQREAQAAARLSHPNVVVIYDADQVADVYFIAMEYVEGIDLHELVKESGRLTINQACDYVVQVARGLQHAFECGLVHRDVKPSNLLVTTSKKGISGFHLLPFVPEKKPPLDALAEPADPSSKTGGLSHNRPGIVKLLDMGLALVKHAPDSPSAQWTEEGTLLGTPDFIAPEQAVNSHTVDVRADLYSLGCTFYYLLTGKAPFGDDPLIKKLMMHQTGEPRPLEELRPEVPASLRRVIRKLMAKRPDERYQTPAELAEAILAAQAAEAAAASPRPDAPAAPPRPDATAAPPAAPPRKVETAAATSRHSRTEPELPPGVTKAAKIAILEGHRGAVTSVAFSPDRKTLASGGVDGGIRLWDLADTEPRDRAVPGAHSSDVNALAFAPDNRLLASASCGLGGMVCLWDYGGPQPRGLATIQTREATFDALAFAPASRLLAGIGSDKHVRVWDVSRPTPTVKVVLKGHSDYVKSVAFASDNQVLASGGQDGTVRLWNLNRFWSKEQAVIQGGWGAVLSLAFAPGDKHLAFACLDQAVRVWSLSAGTPERDLTLKGHLGVVRLVHFNPDGQTLISVCDGGRIILWNVATSAKEREWLLPRAKIYSIAVTRDGRYLATGNSDGSVFLFRLYPRTDNRR